MKRLYAVTATILVSGSIAHAADLPQAHSPMAPVAYMPVAAPFTWTGFYAGINGGYSWGTVKTNDGVGDIATLNSNGGIVGGTVGYNYQINQFVIGFEGDIDWSGMRWSQSATNSSFFGTSTATANYKDDVLSTFAARFGLAAGRALYY